MVHMIILLYRYNRNYVYGDYVTSHTERQNYHMLESTHEVKLFIVETKSGNFSVCCLVIGVP